MISFVETDRVFMQSTRMIALCECRRVRLRKLQPSTSALECSCGPQGPPFQGTGFPDSGHPTDIEATELMLPVQITKMHCSKAQ